MLSEVDRLSGHGQPLLWGNTAQCHVWTVVIVFPHPLGGVKLNFLQVGPVILGQPFVAHGPVEALNIGVLLRVAWLDVFKVNASVLGPRSAAWATVCCES